MYKGTLTLVFYFLCSSIFFFFCAVLFIGAIHCYCSCAQVDKFSNFYYVSYFENFLMYEIGVYWVSKLRIETIRGVHVFSLRFLSTQPTSLSWEISNPAQPNPTCRDQVRMGLVVGLGLFCQAQLTIFKNISWNCIFSLLVFPRIYFNILISTKFILLISYFLIA